MIARRGCGGPFVIGGRAWLGYWQASLPPALMTTSIAANAKIVQEAIQVPVEVADIRGQVVSSSYQGDDRPR